ncbi:MAG: prolyl oligopeptidase family serine peptidase [Bacteroidota bacterium]|nr:prolyl oligopeptidase family serine peptidase [Bacteroidota bacterium]
MKYSAIIFLSLGIFFTWSCNPKSQYTYPETRKDTVVDDYFGTKVPDPYRWLEDDNSEETKAWVQAQIKVTDNYLNAIPFKDSIKNRLTEIYNYEKYSTPFREGGKYFWFKNNGLQNQSVLYLQNSLEDEAKVLLDPNTLSEDGTIALSGLGISENGKYLAYSVSSGGSDWQEIFVKNIETGKQTQDNIKWVKFSGINWYKDGFFYSRYPAPDQNKELSGANEFQKVYYHKLGTIQEEDILIFENKTQPSYMYGISLSENEKYIFLYESKSTSGNALYFSELNLTKIDFKAIQTDFDSDFRVIDHVDGKFLVLTNNKASRYRLMAVDPMNPEEENREIIIPESEDVLRSVTLAGNNIVANYMHDAHSKLKLFDLNGKNAKDLKLPGIGSIGGFSGKKGESIAFYTFSSYTVPPVIYSYDFESQKSEIYRETKIKGINFDDYETKQVFYKSKDGTQIPLFITHKKHLNKNSENHTLLYGYGGFNISLTPSFSITRMIWMENGGVFAVANLRGGGEYGEDWHKAGTKLNKQNVFDDFIAAGEYLIEEKYTNSEKLAIEGGSNGGLLVGAVSNQRPELFAVSVAHVGVMDMLRYQYFTIGRAWRADYGLSEDSLMFDYLYNYSPLHNISKDAEYPAVLVITADHDDRVVPAHSFKYMATLQEKYSGQEPVMIRIEAKAGHGAGKPVSKRIEESADIYGFIYKNMEINPYK